MIGKPAASSRGTRIIPIAACLALFAMVVYIVREETSPVSEPIRKLRSGDSRERVEAILELSQVKSRFGRVVPALIDSLGDADSSVRSAAAEALSMMPPEDPQSKRAIPALVSRVQDQDPVVCIHASRALVRLRTDPYVAIPALIAAARADRGEPSSTVDERPPTPSRSARPTTTPRSLPVQARECAVEALGTIGAGDPVALQALRALALDPLPALRATVARTLGRNGRGQADVLDVLIDLVSDQDFEVRTAALQALGRFAKGVPPAPPTRPSAAEARDEVVRRAIDRLLEALLDADPGIGYFVAEILCDVRPDPRLATPALLAAAKLRCDSPARLSALADPESSQSSVRSPASNAFSRENARTRAVWAIGVIGPRDPAALSAMRELAGDPAPTVRMAVVQSIASNMKGDPAALAILIGLAEDPEPRVRLGAVGALGDFTRELSVVTPILFAAFRDGDETVRESARSAIQKVVAAGGLPAGFDSIRALKSDDAALRYSAALKVDPRSFDGFRALVDALRDEDARVREQAVASLIRCDPSRAEAALRAIACVTDDRDASVRRRAAIAQSEFEARRTTVPKH